jgi:hypothetical protein
LTAREPLLYVLETIVQSVRARPDARGAATGVACDRTDNSAA